MLSHNFCGLSSEAKKKNNQKTPPTQTQTKEIDLLHVGTQIQFPFLFKHEKCYELKWLI